MSKARANNDRIAHRLIRQGAIKVTADGEVWRRGYTLIRKGKRKDGKPIKVPVPAKVLAHDTMNDYRRVKVKWEGVKYAFPVHRLVMLQFHGPSDHEVNHINGDRSDNRLVNLEYVTRRENLKGKRDRVYRPGPDEVEELKERYRKGESINSLAIEKGCTWQTMKRILKDEDQRKPGHRRDTTIDGYPLGEWCWRNKVGYDALLHRRQRYGLDTKAALHMLLQDTRPDIDIDALQIVEPAPRPPKQYGLFAEMKERGYLPFKDVMDELGVSRNVRWRWVKQGRVEVVRPGGKIFFVHQHEYERLMELYGRKEAA